MRNLIGKALASLPIIAGATVIFTANAQAAWALFEVPEIDPGSAGNAVALVFGLMLLVVGVSARRRAAQSASR